MNNVETAKAKAYKIYSTKTDSGNSLPVPSYDRPISDRVLSHVQADFFIKDAPGQEGISLHVSFHYLIHCLRQLPEKLKSPEVLKLIQECEQCYSIFKKISDYDDFCEQLAKNSKISESEIESKKEEFVLGTVKDLQDDVKGLQVGQRILIPGGWNGKEVGHSMMYIIEKQKDGKYSFYIFNTGSGINLFHHYDVDQKRKFLRELQLKLFAFNFLLAK